MARPIGDASALKMSYAGITKGLQALATAMAPGAAKLYRSIANDPDVELDRALPASADRER